MSNFIESIIEEDLKSGKHNKIIVRFPPEPNGYLHLGHVKSIVLNSYLAEKFSGEFNLRFDDTNPEKENLEYVNSIKKDVNWITDKVTRTIWASDYFDKIYLCAEHLIKEGLAYVDDDSIDLIREKKGNYNNLGVESNFRNRTIEKNIMLFKKMKNGDFKNGEKVLRAKINMKSSNINMRDPILYRIKHTNHHNTGDTWCIYPMYDFAHPISDALEGITHSICTIEFEDHRPLYDWVVNNCYAITLNKPTQIEFARLEMNGIILSKRKLNELVINGNVSGWEDSSMPTISGLRNRGYTSLILKDFIIRSGFSKANSKIEKSVLDDCVRENLNPIANRTMAIINPVNLFIENFNEIGMENIIECHNHPKNIELGTRKLTLSPNIWVEYEDIKLKETEGFWRIFPGNWVRLKNGYNLLIKEVLTDENGKINKVIAEIDPLSRNLKLAKHKAKVAIHWLSFVDSIDIEANFYGELCDKNGEYSKSSLIKKVIKCEYHILNKESMYYEFERNGYFYIKNNIAHNLCLLKNKDK